MKISLQNTIKGLSEYLSDQFANNVEASWTNMGVALFAEYKLHTQGIKMLKQFDNGEGFIPLDLLEQLVDKYGSYLRDETFKTAVGDITISRDTPHQIVEYLKKYGEN